jgi:hypothetical protein
MTDSYFRDQVKRLRMRFGDRAFDNEFVLLVWREVYSMSEVGFQRLVDVLIGSRSANKPPLLSDFREARIKEDKWRFDNEVKSAARVLQHPSVTAPIKEVLKRDFGGVESVKDALEIARLKLRTNKPDDGGAA